MSQLTKNPEAIRRIIRAIQAQQVELDMEILREPTGGPREQLTQANIHMLEALHELKDCA